MANFAWGNYTWGDGGTGGDAAGSTSTTAVLVPATSEELAKQQADGSATSTAASAVKFGEVFGAGDIDYYRIDLVAGTNYVFTLTANTGGSVDFSPHLELFKGQGTSALISTSTEHLYGTEGVASFAFEASESSTYYLSISSDNKDASNGLSTGEYLVFAGISSSGGTSSPTGTDGNDRFALTDLGSTFDAGGGLDVITFSNARAGSSIVTSGNQITVDGATQLTNVERLQFSDGTLAFDLDGTAGQTYRLYKAAFDRAPDQAGLGHNINLVDQGLGIYDLANAFIGSAEFQATYGDNVDDTQFLTLLYNNVLNRGPDNAGLQGWLDLLSSGEQTRQQVLFGFSESAENKSNVAAEIDDGIWF